VKRRGVQGEGVEVSYERAFEYYEQAAHLGYAKAQFSLAVVCTTKVRASKQM
jgi:TPR repeat protein